jgi:1,4-dihydroxy-2-naphthoate octaprenyltransferase
MYRGKLLQGIIWLFVVGGLYILDITAEKPKGFAVIGVILHLFCISYAYNGQRTEAKYSMIGDNARENDTSKSQAE